MKKLLCMMLGLAVGAFAYGEGTGGDYGFTANEGGGTETLSWVGAGEDDESAVVEFGETEAKYTYAPGNEAYSKIGLLDNKKYLKVKNSLSTPGFYTNTTEQTFDFSKTVCFDTLVRFTAGIDAATVQDEPTLGGGKIGVWLKQVDTDTGIEGETNLYVTAGFWDTTESKYIEKAFPLNKKVEPGTWHRVTIRTIQNVLSEGNLAGFLVYVDGKPVTVDTEEQYYLGKESGFTGAASTLMTEKKLFISATGEGFGTSAQIGFAGNGDIDDTSITWGNAVPSFAIDAVATYIKTDNDGLTNICFKVGAGDWVNAPISIATPYELVVEPGATVTFNTTGFKYATSATESYAAKAQSEWAKDSDGWMYNGAAWSLTGGADSYITIAVEETPFAVALYDKNGKFIGGFANADLSNLPAGFEGTIKFLKQVKTTDYTIPPNTEIAIADRGKWTVTVPNGKLLEWCAGFENGKQVVVNGNIYLGGLINGGDPIAETTVTVTNGTCTIALDGLTIGDASNGKGAALIIGEDGTLEFEEDGEESPTYAKISLDVNGRLVVGKQIAKDDWTTYFEIIPTDYEIDETELMEEQEIIGYQYALKPVEKNYVAQIGSGKQFETLAEAFAEAAATDTVTLLANVALDKEIAIYDKDITLEGAFTVSTSVGKAFNVRHGATLTIAAGTTVTASGTDTTIFVWPYEGENAVAGQSAKATLIVNGTVTYTGSNGMAAITTHGNDSLADSEGVEIVINGTVSNTDDAALYLPGKGVYTVNAGANITGVWAGIQMKSGTLTVNGGTISCTGADSTPTTPYNNGANKSGCAIQLEGNGSYWGNMTLTVNDGMISAAHGKAIYGYGDATKLGAITLNGGTFECGHATDLFQFDTDRTIIPGTSKAQFDRDVSKFCVADYKTVKLEGDDYFTVVPREYVAQVGTDKFETVAEALAKVQELEAAGTYPINVTALDDVTIPGTVAGDSLMLAKNGTIAITANSWTIAGTVSGEVTLAYGKTLVVPAGSEVTVSPTSSEDYEIKKSTADNKDTYTVAEVAKEITITLVKGTGIAKILVSGEEKEGEVKLAKETTAITIELVADDTIKIPVYKNGDTVIGKVTTAFAVADKESYTFKAEEASEEEVTEDQAKQALKDAGMSDEKLEAAKTAGGVTAKQIANWAKDNGGATALAGDYVGASVALGVAPISTGTPVKIETLTKGEGTVLTFKVKVGDDDVSGKAAITSMVKATDDLAKKAWELEAGVAIEGNTVKVTPPTDKTQAFIKVVIPADAPAAE